MIEAAIRNPLEMDARQIYGGLPVHHLDGLSLASTSESESDSIIEDDPSFQQHDGLNQTLTEIFKLDQTHECQPLDQLECNHWSRQPDPMDHIRWIQQLGSFYDSSAEEEEPIQKKANITFQSGIMRVSYKMLPPHFKRAWKLKQRQKKEGRRRNRKTCPNVAKSCVKFTITSVLGFDSEGEDLLVISMGNKSEEHIRSEEQEWLRDLNDTEEEFNEDIVAQSLNTMSALGDQTSIWEEDDKSEMKSPRRNLFTSSPKQPSSEESKRSSKDSAISSITPTELKFSSPESYINSKTTNDDDQSQFLAADNSAIQSPFRKRRFKAIYPRKRMNTSYRKRRKANPASPTHLVIESVDDQLYTSLLFNVSALKTEEASQDPGRTILNSTPTSDKKPSKKFKLFGITFKNPFKKEFQQERTTTEAGATTTEGGHSRDD